MMIIITFITSNSTAVLLIEGLCSSNPYRFEFSIFGGIMVEPTIQGFTVLRSDQLRKGEKSRE